jgi:hypothetical protein
MAISERPRRLKAAVSLAGFVVAFGIVSWYVTGGTGPHSAPAPLGDLLTATPGPTPIPLECAANELELVGAFGECVAPLASPLAVCSASGHILEAVLLLGHGNSDALLYIEIDGPFHGAGTYDLGPWTHPLGTNNDPPKIALQQDGTSELLQRVNGVPVEQYGTDTFWQSVGGAVTVTGSDGRAGTVSAVLEMSAGHNATAPGTTLTVSGAWRCP